MNPKKTLFLIFILFVASFATRFYFAYFNKIILIYPDELRYLHLAQNFAELKGLEIYNLPTKFQKILYPLFLSPAFFFENITSQQFCIAVIHSFLVASSIFPVFLIAKILLKSNTNILIICSISIFMVDLAYSMTFMSEILFLPLSLWLFYGFSKLIIRENKKSTNLCIVLGILSYAAYLCKEVGIVLPFCFLLYIITAHFFKIQQNLKESLKCFAIIILIFSALFILMKLTFFAGLGNSYHHQHSSPDVLFETGRISYLFFSAFYFLMHLAVSCLVYPLFLPLIFFKNLNDKNKKTFLFLLILILSMTFILAYSIFIREDFFDFHEKPRAALRFVPFLWMPILIVFFSLFENKIPKTKNILFLIIPIFCILFFYNGIKDITTIDQQIGFLLPKNAKETEAITLLHFKILLCFSFVLFYFGLQKFKKQLLWVFVAIFVFLQIQNNARAIYCWQELYSINNNEIKNILETQSFIKNNADKIFLLAGSVPFRGTRIADSFLNFKNLKSTHILNLLNLNGAELKNTTIPVLGGAIDFQNPVFTETYYLKSVDFLIFPAEFAEKLTLPKPIFKNSNFWIIPNPNPKTLPIFEKK